jgi:hypothetical protein
MAHRWRVTVWIAIVVAAAQLAQPLVEPGAVGDALAQQAPGRGDEQEPPDGGPGGSRGPSRDEQHPKMDAHVASSAAAARRTGDAAGVRVARERGLDAADAMIQVVVESAAADPTAARAVVVANGGIVEAEYASLIQARLAPSALDPVAADPSVRYVRVPRRPQPDATAGEGVGASGANVWQAAGQTGAGVKVGIVDFGFSGYTTRQAQGDLPPSVTTQDFCGGQLNAPGGEHGTAVAEVVHEMAPGAQLYLICIGTDVNLGQAKDYAIANGLAVIVMSASFYNTSRGDGSGGPGSPDAVVAAARAAGILWVNSAGNRAQHHWSGTFSDTNANNAHNFDANDEGLTFFLGAGAWVCAYLKWDSWPATSVDYNLRLRRSSDGVLMASSASVQNGSQAPVEGFCWNNNTGVGQNFYLSIVYAGGSGTPRMDLFAHPGGVFEYQTAAGSMTEPGSSPNTMSAAAICWQNNRLESYSSRGPTIDNRVKPDIAGQSVVSSASYGIWASCPAGSNGSGGFNGTSAAAPHVAGAAALVKAANPSFTPAQVQAFLEERAGDLGAAGKDSEFGSGKLTLGATPAAPLDLALALTDAPDPVSLGQDLTYTATVTNGSATAATGVGVDLNGALTGATFVSSTCPGARTGTQCTGFSVPAGGSVSFQFVVRPTGLGARTVNAGVSGGQPDPNLGNNFASATTTVNEPPVACSPRPRIALNARPAGANSLAVTISATGQNNTLRSVRFGTDARGPAGALIDVPNGPLGASAGFVHPLADRPTEWTFTVRRAVPGQPVTVPLVVTDACGTWETLVGGGIGAGF